MKVLFDHQIFDSQKYGGISRYFSEIIKIFSQKNYVSPILDIKDAKCEYLFETNFLTKNNSRTLKSIVRKIRNNIDRMLSHIFKSRNLKRTVKMLRGQDFDLFHPTYYSNYFLKYLNNKPFVLTVYDMIHETLPEYFMPENLRTTINKKNLIERASAIIAISHNTKKDLMRIYGIPAEKIEVVYLASSLGRSTIKKIKPVHTPKRYFLYVGGRSFYKNFEVFLASVAPILRKDPDLYLVISGGYSENNKLNKQEEKNINNLCIKNQVLFIAASDQELAYLYSNAICFVFPSLYEGFGLPILEAFSCDCPVVLSNTSSMPEIAGDAGLYFDPKDGADITEKVGELVYNENLRKLLVERGRTQLNRFSWEKTATETIEVYKKALRNK